MLSLLAGAYEITDLRGFEKVYVFFDISIRFELEIDLVSREKAHFGPF